MNDIQRLTSVYVLIDEKGAVRYVGISTKPRRRLWRHIDDAKKGSSNHCHRWIAAMLRAGHSPRMVVIEENVPEEREVFWMEHHRALGASLTNVSRGGGSSAGFKHSPEAVAEIIRRNTGRRHSEATRAAIAASLRGQRLSSETRSRLSAVRRGKPKSETMRLRLSAAMKGRQYSPQTIERMRQGAHRRGGLSGAPRDERGRLLPKSQAPAKAVG